MELSLALNQGAHTFKGKISEEAEREREKKEVEVR